MACAICDGVDLDIPRCPGCGRLPDDTQLAILTEAYDLIDIMAEMHDTTVSMEPEIFKTLKTLTGVVKHLVVENNKMKREILVLKDEKYQ